jgi:flagellar hook protein FlgE
MAVGSFSAGLSGLSANSTYLSVIGNNLANINTVGFKASAVSFADLVSQTVGSTSANPTQVGLGVVTGSISPVFSQGNIENASEPTNVAIQGNGFFIVSDPNGGGNAYTRAGNFSFNEDGALQSPDGWKVQGYTAKDPVTGAILTTGQPTDIIVPPGVLQAPKATSSITTQINLDANATINATAGAYEYTQSVQVYDSKGTAHVLTLAFDKTGAGAWNVTITAPTADLTGAATPPQTTISGPTALTFNANGQLTAPTADITIPTQNWANGATTPAITWDIIPPTGPATITSFDSPSAAPSITQNGSPAGQIENITIDSSGSIIASFGAGQTITVGQLAMANFNNPKGLQKLGSNRYGETQSAGVANIGVAGTGGRGTITGNALESSNVDMAQEFTKMILAQRGYQANARSITTADEVLVETLNLKR